MATLTIELPRKLPSDVGREIAKRACYVDSAISGCQYDNRNNALKVAHDSTDDSKIRDKLGRLVDSMKSDRLAIQPKTTHSRIRADNQFNVDVYATLSASGDLFKESPGVVARGGEFLKLLNAFDSFFEKLGVSIFGAQIRSYNSLVPGDWLKRAGYFSSFAHSVTFAMHLTEDLHSLEKFAERHRDGADLNFESLDELTTSEYCLSPAVCYHTYGALMNDRFDVGADGLKVFTAMGRCFRYESKNITDLDRLWEFSMREIVFVGEKEKVLKARRQSLELIWRLVERLDLTATVETASDPFFATDFKSLRYFQLANDLKYELLLPVDAEKSIAAASFNYHENFFGSRFDISTVNGEPVHTGCAAFGLERLVYACLAQIGLAATLDRLGQAERELITPNPAR